MSEDAVPSVGLIGLGVMGSAIARVLMRRGVHVTGYDIDEARVHDFAARGGEAARSPEQAAAASSVVMTSLPSATALDQAVAALTSSPHPDLLVIELSTLAIADKERGRIALAKAGGRLVDAPLSGTGAQARSGDLVAFVSADDPADRDRARVFLAKFTRAQYDVGRFGNGSRFKYVANLLVAIHNVASAEALVLAERAGLDLDLILAAVGDGAGSSRMLQVRGPLMIARDYDPTIRLEIFLKDLALIGEFAASVGAPTPLLDISTQLYLSAEAAGRASEDTASVAEVLREQTL